MTGGDWLLFIVFGVQEQWFSFIISLCHASDNVPVFHMERKLSIFFFPFSYDDVMFTKKKCTCFWSFFLLFNFSFWSAGSYLPIITILIQT